MRRLSGRRVAAAAVALVAGIALASFLLLRDGQPRTIVLEDFDGHSGGAPGMNGELRIFPQLGYVVVSQQS
jgi:hypothetical protein